MGRYVNLPDLQIYSASPVYACKNILRLQFYHASLDMGVFSNSNFLINLTTCVTLEMSINTFSSGKMWT
jgi:hypothetical protein